MAEPCKHLDVVLLELLSRASPVPLLAPAEVIVDRFAVELETRRKAGHDGDECRPVRLTRREEPEGHTGKPKAVRIAPIGAGTPVQSSNEAAPWAARTSSPPMTRAPASRAASAVAVSG